MQSPELMFLNSLLKKPYTWVKQDKLLRTNVPDIELDEVVKKANAALKKISPEISLNNDPPIYLQVVKDRPRPARTSYKTGKTIPAYRPRRDAPYRYIIYIHAEDLLNLYLENEKNLFRKKLEKEIRSQIPESEGEAKINMDEINKVIDEAAEAHIDSLKKKIKEFNEEKWPFKPR